MQDARELVRGEEIRGVRHADEIAAAVLFDDERAMPARVRFRQLRHDLVVERDVREIDERNLQRRRETAVQIGLGHRADVDEHAAELAAAAPLFLATLP